MINIIVYILSVLAALAVLGIIVVVVKTIMSSGLTKLRTFTDIQVMLGDQEADLGKDILLVRRLGKIVLGIFVLLFLFLFARAVVW